MTTWVLPVDEDGMITLPEDLLEATGWQPGDRLEWIDLKDGSFQLVKKVMPKSWTPEEEEAWQELERKQKGHDV